MRYKFINKSKDSGYNYCAFNHGQEYDGEYTVLGFSKVSVLAKHYPEDWEEVCEVQFVKTLIDGVIRRVERPWTSIDSTEPSTEKAYYDQLVNECSKRFGEIKDGERYDCSALGLGTCPIEMHQGAKGFFYWKDLDEFRKGGFTLYKNGKWATKLPNRTKVQCRRQKSKGLRGGEIHTYKFKVSSNIGLPEGDAGAFLASQYESFLNGEIK